MQGPQCMTFWYHMHGRDMGHLAVYSNNNGLLRLLWLKGGEQGHYWHKALINIRENGEYKVEIDGVRGRSYRGDAAIDDISFYPGACKEQVPPVLYVYDDSVGHGFLDQQGLPSPGPRSLQFALHLQQEPLDQHDQFYLVCQGSAGLTIMKTAYMPRKVFPCEPRDFFYSSNSAREGLYPFFVIDRGKHTPQMISLKNDTSLCKGQSSVTKLFATYIDLSVNRAHNGTVSLSSHEPGFPATFAIDKNHATCAKSLKQNNPWIEIKLDGSRFTYKVYVTTRQNCSHGDHLPNITVTIYDQNIEVSCQTTDQTARKMSRVFLCQPPIRAHKVRVKNHGKQTQLLICEVIVNAVDSLEYLRGVRAETWRSISYKNDLETFFKSPKRFNSPDISKTLYEFFDQDFGLNNHGQRLTSFIQSPSRGKFKFYAMCDDQCKVWIKDIKNFQDVSVFEDMERKKQELFQLIFVPRYTGYGRWSKYSFQMRKKDLDYCHMYMLEEVAKDGQGPGYVGLGWKNPAEQYNRPLSNTKMFWILPGLQMLNTTLREPSMKQSSLTVGQTMKILMSYRLCCHGIYCPSCSKSVRLQLLGYNFMVNTSLATTCQWYDYTTSFVILNHPGKYDIKVLESTSNTSIRIHNIRDLEIKARVLQSCFYQDASCPWTITGDDGRMGWVAVQTANNRGRHLEAEANTTARLHSPIVQPQPLYRSIGLCLVFLYRNNHESSQLEVTVNTLYNKTVLWYLRGMQGSLWNEATIPWPDDSVNQIQIRAKTVTNGSVAVSDIRLSTITCSLTPKHATPGHICKADEFQCHNGDCVKSALRCDGDFACVDKSDESNCACRSTEYECPDGKCLPVSYLCNGLKECADGSDEESCGNPCKENQFPCLDGSCVSLSFTCDGVWDCRDGSDEPGICSSLRCPLNNISCATTTANSELSKECRTFRGPCNFEYGFCGFTTSSTNQSSKAKWQIKKGPTPTSGTGPSIDHTKLTANGSYLYLEVSGLDPGDAAQLSSNWLQYDSVTCLQFWYHMWGRHVSALNVYVITNQTKYSVWSRTGDSGPKWKYGQTTIYSNGSSFQFVFEATAGNGSEGDIAIDDVDLITGKCDFSIFGSSDCNFESDYCNWKSNAGWVLQNEDSQSADITNRDKQSVGFARTNPEYVDVTPTMESPVIYQQKGFKCLRFWYYIKTVASIQLYSINVSDLTRERLWHSNKLTKTWSFIQIPLQVQHKYRLSFETNKQVPGVKLVVAIDDILLSRDSCRSATSMNENCKMRTTAGDCCVFPFVYKNRCYSYCIGVDGVNPWCSLTDNYDRDGKKGFCVGGNTALKAPVISTKRPCSIITENGKTCTFPFKYRNMFYTQCLTTSKKPWCGTTPNVDVNKDGRGYCNITSLEQCGLCKQKTSTMACCVFPFIYRSRKYYSCTTSHYDRYWCSLTQSYDKDSKYGVCKGYETPMNCRVSYSKQQSTLRWTPIRGLSPNVTWSPRLPTADALVNKENATGSNVYIQDGVFKISFNGSSKGLYVWNIPDLESFTACVWVKTNDTVNQGTPFRYYGTNSTGFGLMNYKNLVMRLAGKEKNSSVSANDGRWHHLCLVWTSKGGVLQMYKDGMFILQEKAWHQNLKIRGGGIFVIGTNRFVGNICGMNVWTLAMGRLEIDHRAVGCGKEGGDIVDWSRFSNQENLIYPPGCLDTSDKVGYKIIQNSTNQISSDLISNVFNSSLADYSIGFCFYFRYLLIGQSGVSLKIYRSDLKDFDTNTVGEELVWSASSNERIPLWRFEHVQLSTLQTFKIKATAAVGPGQGSVGLAGYFTKPGHCPSFSAGEKRGCHAQMTSESGTFSSPYFPDPYPDNIHCKWWISRPVGYIIRLKFLSFELEDSQSCEDDYVVVYDGSSSRSNIVGKYCGDSFPLVLESSSNSLLVVFNSDNERSLPGFKMSYTSYIKEKEECNFIENCPSSCTCTPLTGSHPPVIIHCKGLTAIPMKTPVNSIAMIISKNRLSRIEYSISSDLQYMDLCHNYIMSVTPFSFTGLKNLTTLRLDYNFIKQLHPNVFTGLSRLHELDLGNNLLSKVEDISMDELQNLQVLSLRSNQISRIEKQAFKFVKNLKYLYLQNNLIEDLPDGVFESLESLKVLKLNNNNLKKISRETFRNLVSLEELYLDKNHIQSIDETTFSDLQSLRVLKLDRFVFCCYAENSIKSLQCESPSSAFSSCDDLMKNKTLQVCIWILGILAFLGNIGVIIWRLIVKERNRVHSFLLTNLAVSDLMMGVYLLMIAIKDFEWRGVYFKHDLQWRSSRVCQLAGALSVVASEVSVLILTTITADRYATIVFAFKFERLKMKSAVFVVSLIWIFGCMIAIFPVLYTDYFYDFDWQVGFYGRSGVCLPLQLSHERFPGWEYSVAIFIGLNFIAFSFILVAYIIMFWKVRSAGRSVRSTQMNTESAMARKMAFIILTDFCCWMPIIIIGVLSLLGKFPDPEKLAYVWIAVFVLPVNSSINPVLYTFSNRSPCEKKKESFLNSFKNRITLLVSRGLSRDSHIPMSNYPSVIMADSLVTTMTITSAPHTPGLGSSRKPKINLVNTNLFEGEFSHSVSFYRSFKEENEKSVFLFKHFCNGERTKWNREVDVIDRLRKDGGHPNIMKHLWYSPVQEAPVLINLTDLKSLQGNGFLICYDLVSCTTLDEYLSKPETDLITQILLAIATDVINALVYLERCEVRHNHVTAKNIVIKESFMVPSLQAVLGGFGRAASDAREDTPNTDIKQYGALVEEQLVAHSPNADPDNQIKEISTKCQDESTTLTAAAVRTMAEEVWDGTGTWDTLL